MFDDTVADFWKDKLVHLLHRNMVRTDGKRLTFEQVPSEFNTFNSKHPELKPVTNISSSYATWEINFTEELKLRLFIQSQIKVTIMQKNGGEYIKLCDARFPNNPFPEVELFLQMLPEYEKMLKITKQENLVNKRQIKVTKEFIKALLQKYCPADTVWTLEEENQFFNLILNRDKNQKTIILNQSDFAEKIMKL